ncbi:hypothetical protein HS088_TW05G00312 [Tripterygium wilfordii]|uniref:Nuclear transport factor 2 family protein n=1 Tax=Tripterygium wilfordii TaxID=458696 RepID=A0A7J7DMN4_TRIWF|nr:uncharacterized protein LOC119998254 [Tripterygium wilfordii]KAF5747587.1 hypothetical protein HS088_TW05G00312 [Tripterygium wilfordii]
MAVAGSVFCSNVSVMDSWKMGSLPYFSINSFRRIYKLSLPYLKRRDTVLADISGVCNLKLCPGRPSPFGGASRLHSLRACQVKNDESEGTLSGESSILDEQILVQDLQIAIKEENYAQAAKIRDSLRVLQEDSKAAVLAINARFYNSFRGGDLAVMQALWAKGDNCCCVHPGASGVIGYDNVMESWEIVWMNYDFPLEIELKDIRVHFRGDAGYVTCVEFIRTKGSSWGAQFVTNVFEKVNGQWFICVHHASPVDL